MSYLIAPSILAADPARLGDEIRAVEAAGADWLHLDVMDGHFVPNLSFGPPVIRGLRKVSRLPFDVHLMVESPERALADYVDAGANILTVHVEACRHLYRTLMHIRGLGARVGVSINPATPLTQLTHVLHLVDVVLVMTVNPGFGGQSFLPEMRAKVADLQAIKRAHGYTFTLEVDGGITAENIASVVQAGGECFVAGSAIFRSADYAHAIAMLRGH
jgi:ribulose-phosphate 3-epimerase